MGMLVSENFGRGSSLACALLSSLTFSAECEPYRNHNRFLAVIIIWKRLPSRNPIRQMEEACPIRRIGLHCESRSICGSQQLVNALTVAELSFASRLAQLLQEEHRILFAQPLRFKRTLFLRFGRTALLRFKRTTLLPRTGTASVRSNRNCSLIGAGIVACGRRLRFRAVHALPELLSQKPADLTAPSLQDALCRGV